MDPFTLSILIGLFLLHRKSAATSAPPTAIDTATDQPITLTPGGVATSDAGSGTTAGSPASLLIPPDIGAGTDGGAGITLTTPDLSTGIGTGAATQSAASMAAQAGASSPATAVPQAATISPAGSILPAVPPGQRPKAVRVAALPKGAHLIGIYRSNKNAPIRVYQAPSGYYAAWGSLRSPPHRITEKLARHIMQRKKF